MKRKAFAIFFLLSILVLPTSAFGKIGVGIGTAKIELNEDLNPGSLHSLPSITVVNTGDEPGEYEVGVEFQENVPELRPQREWFIFEPNNFHLEPEESRVVNISLNLPLKVIPGDYFAYIEGRPLKKAEREGGSAVGIAAAAKLYFTVKPANFISGVYYRLNSLWHKYAPWTYIATVVIFGAIIIVVASRFISFDIGIRRKGKKRQKKIKEEKHSELDDVNKVLSSALVEVEKYTAKLSKGKFNAVFKEARENKQSVINFFYKNDNSILTKISPELKNILLLSKKGLYSVKYTDKNFRNKVFKKMVLGIISK